MLFVDDLCRAIHTFWVGLRVPTMLRPGAQDAGIDVCYPKENKKLFEKVLAKGHHSELPIDSHPAPENFPVRNRIIAGMPLGVVIVEGNQHRGSLETSFAPNLLIKQGAKLVRSAEVVIKELPTSIRASLVQAEAVESEQRNLLVADGLNPEEKRIYELLSTGEPRQIDDIVETSGLNSSEVLATLFNLEMKGIVRQSPSMQFTKVCRRLAAQCIAT